MFFEIKIDLNQHFPRKKYKDGFTVGDQSYEPQQPSSISFNEEESGDSVDNNANDKVEELQSRMETTQVRGEAELTDQEMEKSVESVKS